MKPEVIFQKLREAAPQCLNRRLENLLFYELPSDPGECLSILSERMDQILDEVRDFERFWEELVGYQWEK